jgi:hypothetical protein
LKSNFCPLGFEIGRKKEPSSHFYMRRAQHLGNYRKSLTHTPNQPPYVGLEVLSLIVALLVKTALVKTIILISKKLSIVFYAVSKTYYGVKEPRYTLVGNRLICQANGRFHPHLNPPPSRERDFNFRYTADLYLVASLPRQPVPRKPAPTSLLRPSLGQSKIASSNNITTPPLL